MFSLQNYSTFRITNVQASQIITIKNSDEIIDLIKSEELKKRPTRLIIGGGANIVFTQDFDGLIIHNQIKKREIIKETNNSITLRL